MTNFRPRVSFLIQSLPAFSLSAALLLATLTGVRQVEAQTSASQSPPKIDAASNTQEESTPLPSAAEAVRGMRLPEGFEVDVFAEEPQVRQPIAMAWDGRGRLWVAENYTYAERSVNYDLRYRDRIIVLEDTDQDGRADRRTVFWDGAQRLTSVEVGMGGVWALCPPHLLFIPDQDGDARPDGEPVVVLDGWDASDARHNFVNGLRWGPDGWLYGRNGILATSRVGRPGCAESERQAINCGIWRYQPRTQRFEVVCHGTTNPWGSDWDEHGEMFFINTVIGHLWHVIPGAHYERMYGADLNPYAYELIPQTADHFHWDIANEKWSDVRAAGVTGESDRRGGGHAHCGLMIYQGDNWPKRYRGELFTINLHGRRLNRDHLQREGATYVGKHRPDFLQVDDPWFRGIDLMYGPDGTVYLLDWSDIGECHENDGVHRTSGRVYRIRYKDVAKRTEVDLPSCTAEELVALQRHVNAWFARQARLEMQRRAAGGGAAELVSLLQSQYVASSDTVDKLRTLWCLHAVEGATVEQLLELLGADEEHLRVWAVRLLVDGTEIADGVAAALAETARRESSGLVLTYLASALQRLPHADRWPLAEQLVVKDQFALDPVFPRMVWYGLEPLVAGAPRQSAELVARCGLPRVTRLISRRLAGTLDDDPRAVDPLVKFAASDADDSQRQAIVEGLAEGLRGWLRAPRPDGWSKLEERVADEGSAETANMVRELSVVFGDGRALEELRRLVTDRSRDLDTRRSAIGALAAARVADLPELLDNLLTDRELGDAAVRAVGVDGRRDTAERLLQRYPAMRHLARAAVVEVLATRPGSAALLLEAVEQGTIDRRDVSPFVTRQIQLLGDDQLTAQVAKLWPEFGRVERRDLERLADYRRRLAPESLHDADLVEGRQVFQKVCGTCHKLFGQGGAIGPELTGAQRSNLDYWLDNVLSPSAQVATNYRMSTVLLDDGRVLNGVLGNEPGRTVTLQTPKEKLTLDRSTIEQVKPSSLSLMPDGLLSNLSERELRWLFAYLMAPAPPR